MDNSLEEIKKLRQEKVKPLVDAFFEWVKEMEPLFDPKSGNGTAIRYALNQEKYLRTFLDEPLAPLDDNASEIAIRPFTTGRKNWVQIDTPGGAEASALTYSIAETAKANNLHPYNYFKYLLEEIPKYVNNNEPIPETLLPWSEELPASLHKPKH